MMSWTMMMNNAYNFTANLSQLVRPDMAAEICKTPSGAFSPECLYSNFCPQFSLYFINTGLWLAGAYLATGWLLWAFWNVLYMKINWERLYHEQPWLKNVKSWQIMGMNLELGIGDLREYRIKVYWDMAIRNLVSKLMFFYILVVIYLSLY